MTATRFGGAGLWRGCRIRGSFVHVKAANTGSGLRTRHGRC